jgi:hypothetical protein
MPLSVVVQSPAHLVRQPVAQSLAALGLLVREFADLGEAVARLNELSPDLVVVDADGAARQWRTLVAGLGGARGRVGVVLLAGRVSFDDAHDAQSLGIALVVIGMSRSSAPYAFLGAGLMVLLPEDLLTGYGIFASADLFGRYAHVAFVVSQLYIVNGALLAAARRKAADPIGTLGLREPPAH